MGGCFGWVVDSFSLGPLGRTVFKHVSPLLCYILYIDQWGFHCMIRQDHRERCPRSSMTWADTGTVEVSTTWRPLPHTEDNVGVPTRRSTSDSTQQLVWCLIHMWSMLYVTISYTLFNSHLCMPWHHTTDRTEHLFSFLSFFISYFYARSGLSDTPWGFTTHTHKSLSLVMLPTFTPNSNPNQPCFYVSDLSSPIFSFYILFYLDPWFTLCILFSSHFTCCS